MTWKLVSGDKPMVAMKIYPGSPKVIQQLDGRFCGQQALGFRQVAFKDCLDSSKHLLSFTVRIKQQQNNLPIFFLRASPPVLRVQTVKLIDKKSKCAGLTDEIGFSAPNSSSLPWQGKVATQLCTSKKECNEWDLTAVQYFCGRS